MKNNNNDTSLIQNLKKRKKVAVLQWKVSFDEIIQFITMRQYVLTKTKNSLSHRLYNHKKNLRSSRPKVLRKKDTPKNFTKPKGRHPRLRLSINNVACRPAVTNFIKKETFAQVPTLNSTKSLRIPSLNPQC